MYLSIDPIVYRTVPTSRLERRLATNPSRGIPLGRADIHPAGLISNYHPFDPSTKWLRHGAINRWLIFRPLWRPCHAGAWQRGSCWVIVDIQATPRPPIAS
jgi:hypothetical protein